jgi:hypothetical protein
MRWNLGSLDPNETVSLTVAFMFGHEEINQNELLFDSSYQIGSGNSCADPTDPNSKQITYTLAYGNPITEPADPNYVGPKYNALVLNQLPAEVDFISALPENYIYDANEHTCRWTIDSIMPGDANSFTITVNITQRAAPGSSITNQASLAMAGKTLSDVETTSVCGTHQLWNYWPLDEGSGTTCQDITANKNDATFNTYPKVTWSQGRFDDCLMFDAPDVNVPSGSSAHLGGSFSVSAWIKPSSLNIIQRAVAKGSAANGWVFGLTDTNKAQWSVTEDTAAVRSLTGTTTFDTGTWHHVVGVFDVENNQTLLYVDRSVENSNAITAIEGSMFNTSNLMIGSSDEAGLYPFNGSVDDVRIYNYALTSAQIEDIYNGDMADNPRPVDYDIAHDTINLSWVRSATATHHDVYLGTSYNAVLNAVIDANEYMGRQTETTYDPDPTLDLDTFYFWRIDESDSNNITTGHIRTFKTSALSNGSFEDTALGTPELPGLYDLQAGATTIDSWICTDLGKYLATITDEHFPTDGTNHLQANTFGQSGNFVLEQTLDVENSQPYILTFDAGKYFSHDTGQWLEVTIDSQSFTLLDDDALDGNFPTIGTPYRFEFPFVTSKSTPTIEIKVNGDNGFFVDNVKVMPPPDITPPTPNAAAFALAPSAIDTTTITMTAVVGFDAIDPIMYYFTETSGNLGGTDSGWVTYPIYTDSGWVTDPIYTDTGLLPGTQYSYTVEMRDLMGNTTAASGQANAITNVIIDILQNGSFEDNTLTSGMYGYWDISDPGNQIDHWTCQTTEGFCLAEEDNNFNFGDPNGTDGDYFLMPSTLGEDLFTLTQDCNVIDGTTYTVSYDVGTSSGNDDNDYIEVSISGQSLRLKYTDFPEEDYYSDASFTFTAVGSTATLQILADAYIGFYIDNVKVQCEIPGLKGDLEPNGDVDLADLQYFAEQWLNTGCQTSAWCDGADLDFNGTVNLMDFTILAENWLRGTP